MLALSFTRTRALLLTLSASLFAFDAAADQVRITHLSDITVPSWVTGDSDIVQDVFVCVYRENSSGSDRSYGITATGDGPGFAIQNGGVTLAYSLTWNDGGIGNPGGGTTSPMVNNTNLSGRNNARIDTDTPNNSDDCNGGSNPTARLRVTITSANMDAASDGTYSGTITLLLSLS